MNAPAKRVLIAAGGTGGHFYPGYVLGRGLRERGYEPLYLVRREDPAAALLDADGLPYVEVPLRGMPRRPGPELLRFLAQLGRSLLLARRIVTDFEPRVVVGMGGYLTFPAALAAWRRRVPVLLHESNAVLGLANRASAPFARRLAMGLPLADKPRVPATLTGTPVRPPLLALPGAAEARRSFGLDADRVTLLVFGGSQGARSVNRLVPEALRRLGGGPFQVLQLPGARDADEVRAAYAGAAFPSAVVPYLHEMERAYAAADLVLCRSGASTLAELAATLKPAVLIPYPAAAANHQERNAEVPARAGAALCLPERRLDAGSLAAALGDLLPSASAPSSVPERRAKLVEMGRRWSALGLPPPAQTLDALLRAVAELAGADA